MTQNEASYVVGSPEQEQEASSIYTCTACHGPVWVSGEETKQAIAGGAIPICVNCMLMRAGVEDGEVTVTDETIEAVSRILGYPVTREQLVGGFERLIELTRGQR